MEQDVEYFNKLASNWDENDSSLPVDKINYILDVANISPGDSILDIGTGTGILLPFLSSRLRHDGTLCALDVSSAMLEIAHRKNAVLLPSPVFILADIEKDKLSDRFNHIMLYCVYPHLHKPVETLSRLYQDNLQPGGTITIAHPMSRYIINNIHQNCPIRSRRLKPVETVASKLANYGINVSYTEDTDDYYIINLSKV